MAAATGIGLLQQSLVNWKGSPLARQMGHDGRNGKMPPQSPEPQQVSADVSSGLCAVERGTAISDIPEVN